MQSHRADSCTRQIALRVAFSAVQPKSMMCQCVSASARPGMPLSLIGSPICVYIFVVYVYSTQLPAARRKARVCQLHDTTHGSSSPPRSWSCCSYSAIISQRYPLELSSPTRLVLSALTSCIHHRTGAGARRSANAMPAPQLYLCKLCHTCHTRRGLVL